MQGQKAERGGGILFSKSPRQETCIKQTKKKKVEEENKEEEEEKEK